MANISAFQANDASSILATRTINRTLKTSELSGVFCYYRSMSFQAYLDNIEQKTGKIPQEFIDLAKSKGYDDPSVKAGEIVAWLKEDFGLGHGHAMALVHVIKNGPKISSKHVGSGRAHQDDSDTLRLDGIKNR